MVYHITSMRSLEGTYPSQYYIQSTRRVRDVSSKIWLLDPDEYALTVLLKKTRRKRGPYWKENRRRPVYRRTVTGTPK